MPWSYLRCQRDERFLTLKTGFTDNRGGFKPKPNSNQTLKAIALPIHQTGGVGGSREAEGLQTTVTGDGSMEQLLNHLSERTKHSLIHQRESRSRAGASRRYALQPPLHKTLYKRHPTGPTSKRRSSGERPEEKGDSPCPRRNPYSNK